jgi:hypothetical protein
VNDDWDHNRKLVLTQLGEHHTDIRDLKSVVQAELVLIKDELTKLRVQIAKETTTTALLYGVGSSMLVVLIGGVFTYLITG